MIFQEIYGCYYNAVAKILSLAVKCELTEEKMNQITHEIAFSESFLTIIPALKEQKWQLMNKHLTTSLRNEPIMPLTTLQRRWLKAISLDPRIKLFRVTIAELENTQPLFTPDDYDVFDKYSDGDPFENEAYIKNFHTILDALRDSKSIRIRYVTHKGRCRNGICIPKKLEYSEKDDKFRLLTNGCRYAEVINIAKIDECEIVEGTPIHPIVTHKKKKEFFVMDLIDERNAMERVLIHFSHFEKQAEKLENNRYKLTIWYDHSDETELVIRVLSFGPMVLITEPERFVELIKKRLLSQRELGLQ